MHRISGVTLGQVNDENMYFCSTENSDGFEFCNIMHWRAVNFVLCPEADRRLCPEMEFLYPMSLLQPKSIQL